MKVSVIGLGKAGLPLAAVIADSGLEVIGVDIDKKRVDDINDGTNPLPEEPELGELIEKYGGSSLKATVDAVKAAKECNLHVVVVPLFIDENKKCDFSIIEEALDNLAKGLKKGDLVVLETTVPPKTTETLVKERLDKAGVKYYLAYSPERIMTGYSISRYKEFPKIIGGIDEKSGKKAFEVYSKFCKNACLVRDSRTAELIKVAEGIYRDVNIALGNELFKISEKLGVDFEEVKSGSKHEFCNIIGPGNVGGHCIPVYPWFLINEYPEITGLIEKAREINDGMVAYYADKLKKITEKGKVAVLGLTYRDKVKELAYSRSLAMVELLNGRNYDVYVNDPMLTKGEIEKLGLKFIDNFEEMEGFVLMNACEEYKERLLLLKEKVVDVKGLLGGVK